MCAILWHVKSFVTAADVTQDSTQVTHCGAVKESYVPTKHHTFIAKSVVEGKTIALEQTCKKHLSFL